MSEPCQNNKTNCLHKRTPRIIHNDETSFKQLLEKDGSASIYTKNFLAVEMFKVVEDLAPITRTKQSYLAAKIILFRCLEIRPCVMVSKASRI